MKIDTDARSSRKIREYRKQLRRTSRVIKRVKKRANDRRFERITRGDLMPGDLF